MEDKQNIYYECDCKACEQCNYMQCSGTSKIEHAENFVKVGDCYIEKSSLDCINAPHNHYCEIELFHKNDKEYWKKYCPMKKKHNRKFHAGWEDECDFCNHSITIDFFNDKDGSDVRARSIHRIDDLPEGWDNLIRKENDFSDLHQTIIKQIKEILKTYPAGGALHIVLDDYNVDTHNIQWCINNAINSLEKDKQLFLDCANNLLKLTEQERLEVIREADEGGE